ncbi:hypothetical protein ASF43_16815 [Pseudorhodoferax sp. Leaf267]|nr:hypothetical protein ASF43_16815 [Pseudorhodoferax sp. Leaf267]
MLVTITHTDIEPVNGVQAVLDQHVIQDFGSKWIHVGVVQQSGMGYVIAAEGQLESHIAMCQVRNA